MSRIGSEAWLRERGVVWVDWYPGDPEDDLHGFVTARERDAFEAGKQGPFRRIVRNHHKLGPIPEEVQAVRALMDKWRASQSKAETP